VFEKQKELGLVPKNAELSRHDPDVQDWDGLSADERKLYARMMEVYAGYLEHTDHHIGRLLDFLREIGEFDNTLIMLISDNGASAEGGPSGSINETSSSTLSPTRWSRTWPPSTTSAAPSSSTITRGGGPGPATPRSGDGSVKPTEAGSATRSSSTGPTGSRPGAR
jgi:arylsulfatase